LGVLLNAGGGALGSVSSIDFNLNSVGSMESADFNGDTYPDLVVTDLAMFLGDPNVHVYFNNGSGAFPTHIDWNVPDIARDAVPGDFNGDGMIDIAAVAAAAQGGNPGTLSIHLNSNNGNFSSTASFSYATPSPASSTYGLDVADFNGNGRPDLVVSTYGGGFKLYLSNANGSFSN